MPVQPPRHRPAHAQTAQQYDKARAKQHARTYDTAWRRLAAAYLREHPLCVDCQRAGLIEPATEVDHRIPVRKAPDRRLDWNNLQSLCKSHHSAKTRRETFGASSGH